MAAKTSRKDISDVLKAYMKDGNTAGTLDEITRPVEALSTGNIVLDYSTGIGGLPVGRIVETFGKPSSGKSTVALQTAAVLQKKIIDSKSSDHILYIDFEHALDRKYAKNLGLDLFHPSVIVTQPEFLEDGAQLARDLVATGQIKLLVWDSVAEALPKAIYEADTGAPQVAIRARIMSQFLQQINPTLFRNDCTAVFINHVQEKIATSGYSRVVTTTTPGGDALKFYASLRLEFAPTKPQSGNRFSKVSNGMEEFRISSDTKVTVVKNKVGPPQRNCTLRIRYGQGFDNFWSAVQVLIANKKITNTASSYYFDRTPGLTVPGMPTVSGRPGFVGEDKLLQYGAEAIEWRDIIINAAAEVLAAMSDEDAYSDSDDDVEDLESLLSGTRVEF